jgi:DNA-binding winged helix-turn-helix (wHTH) protein/tetratricopeptide (TPR) repeat protein
MKVSTAVLANAKEPEFSFGNFKLWPDGTFLRDQTQIHLPPKEMAALRFLLTHAGQVVTPAQLKQALWGDVHVTSDSVPRCLSSLRAALEPEQCIQTIYKRGYRLIGPVSRSGSEARTLWHVAIMPFATGHNVAEHLGPAIAEEVTTRLTAAGPSWISVLARDSVFNLAHRGLTAIQVGEALHADIILAGTLVAMPTHYRLRAEMIRVEDGIQIWVEDLLVAQDLLLDLESQLVQRLIFRLGGECSAGPGAPLKASVRADAYEAFLRGRHECQTHERHRMQDGMQHLLEATELDPSLVSAQIDLGDLCVTQEVYGFLSPDAAARQIRRIGESISDITLDAPALLPTLGWINFHVDRDLAGALDLFSASAHLPHTASTTRLRVMFALSRHRFDEAVEWLQSALSIDPFAPWLHVLLAWTHHLAGRQASSVESVEKALALFPDHEATQACGALILSFNGHAERGAKLAQDLVRRTPYFDIATAIHAYAIACNGQRDEACGILERLQWLSRERFVLRSFLPAAFAALGSVDEAIAELQAADDARCPWFFQMLADPRLESLHGRAEFELMRESLEKLEFAAAENLEYQT